MYLCGQAVYPTILYYIVNMREEFEGLLACPRSWVNRKQLPPAATATLSIKKDHVAERSFLKSMHAQCMHRMISKRKAQTQTRSMRSAREENKGGVISVTTGLVYRYAVAVPHVPVVLVAC